MVFYVGSHISISDGLLSAAKQIKKVDGNLMQIYLSTNEKMPRNKNDINKFKKYIKQNNIKVVIHSSYKLNIARNWDKYSWWVHHIIMNIKYAHQINAFGIIIHFGKQLNLSKSESYNNMLSLLLHVIKKTHGCNVKIILETTSGQGTELCYKLEDLAYFYKKISKHPSKIVRDRIKLCIDTCHIFVAGYDIRTKKKIKMYFEAFEELIGFNNVVLIHLNDSLKSLGSKRDRHQPIGKGTIGYNGLIEFYKKVREFKIPVVLETPGYNYKDEISMLVNI